MSPRRSRIVWLLGLSALLGGSLFLHSETSPVWAEDEVEEVEEPADLTDEQKKALESLQAAETPEPTEAPSAALDEPAPTPSPLAEAPAPAPETPEATELPEPETPIADAPSEVAPIAETPPSMRTAPEPEPSSAPETVAKTPEPAPVTPLAETPHEEPAIVRRDSATSSEFDPRIPLYQQEHPYFGLEVSASLKPFGGNLSTQSGAGSETAAKSFYIRGEYQPDWLGKSGVLGLGITAGMYPILGTSVTTNSFSVWSVGAQVRYQAKYFINQPVVPWAGFALEYLRYSFTSGTAGGVMVSGPFIGGGVLLSFLDPDNGAEFYAENGVKRTYAFAEYRLMKGTSTDLALASNTFTFGLRFEF